ncbi:hypothetical protein MATL_G00219840 [Megalops atlanticus]|uniref:Multivesicular body subunit 12A n=1 Tax=Megalops atlanticus TaxID=7932 RepID=A0A9D3SXL7_MEGAT|nr:hypothetical protein MATL_G00219840 [Megalops atlanticus]
MSLYEANSAHSLPVTAVAWTSNSTTCPKDFSLISMTQDGAAANFVRGFGMKSGYYLCFSTNAAGGMVVSDIQIITDKEPIPHGYCYIPEYLEPKASVWKKKRVCVRVVPRGSVETAVLDIRLTGKSKVVLQHYTCLGDIHGPPLPLRPSNTHSAPSVGKLSRRRSNLDIKDPGQSVYDSSNIYGISAMDGVPFVLHPRFETQASRPVPSNALSNICIKSVQDIENEYNYTFAVEESAASRTRPTSLTSHSH